MPFKRWHIFGDSYYRLINHGYKASDAHFFLSFLITSLMSYAVFCVIRFTQTIIFGHYGRDIFPNKILIFGLFLTAMEIFIVNMGISDKYSRKAPSVMKGVYENTYLYFIMLPAYGDFV